MPSPIGSIAKQTATGDTIAGPGYPRCIVMGLPVCCVGDAVAGPMCTGVVSVPLHPTMLFGGRPVGAMTANVTGANPITGIPVTTPILVPGKPTWIV